MHFGDSIFIFLLALVLFGPKKLPEIGRTIGKLLAEFRRASNEFKFQIQEELRNMEEDERRKKLAEMQAQKTAETPADASLPAPAATPTILPPSTGAPVNTSAPFAPPAEPTPAEEMPPPSGVEAGVEPPIAEAGIAGADAALNALPPPDARAEALTNGAHPPAVETEPVSSDVPSETIHHG
ncbi:MAG TPA: twin-arginine translocase TatA/TatE family subunit [Acidobacteriaceae bacterium]|nr:twin-arginine translocase TatA/TatE family subunit [Acidobacteriaceae bacterium]